MTNIIPLFPLLRQRSIFKSIPASRQQTIRKLKKSLVCVDAALKSPIFKCKFLKSGLWLILGSSSAFLIGRLQWFSQNYLSQAWVNYFKTSYRKMAELYTSLIFFYIVSAQM